MTDTSRSKSSTEMSCEAPAQRLETSEGRRYRAGSKRTEEDRGEVEDEADADKGPSVLWEKHFEQSIFVDISDDDSLHLSDLQGSFRIHVSQHEDSENKGLSNTFESEEDSSESSVSISSEHKNHINIRDMKGNEGKVNTAQERPRWRPEEDNTSDEDQEELPYDGELQQQHHTYHTEESPEETSKDHHTINADMRYTPSKPTGDAENVNGGTYNSSLPVEESLQLQEPSLNLPSVPEFLLRHFSHDELLNCSRLIEAETMPEVSLLDSVDETAWSRASANLHTAGALVGGHIPKLKARPSLVEEDESSRDRSLTDNTERTDSQSGSDRTAEGQHKTTDKLINHSSVCNQPDSTVESRPSRLSNLDSGSGSSAEDEQEKDEEDAEDKEKDEENAGQSCSASTPDLAKADIQSGRFSLGRTRSCGELKYGQGQVHYPLPDFSKVASKVKIPKGNSPTKPGTHTPSTDRPHATTSGTQVKSPSSCTADVISRVLEDSVWLSEVRKDEEEQARLDQLLQAEYHRLLAKYADDDKRINLNQDSINQPPSKHWRETADVLDVTQGQPRAAQPTFQSTIAELFEKRSDAERRSPPEQQSVTDGQRLTAELTTIINQFTEQMEEFKKCISTMSTTVEEQQTVFKSMMEAQDQLERNYMSKKEEHRVLEMQNYMGLNRDTGEFDPDRQVEGEIFRLGMQLEDIKEQIDRNACCTLSPPPPPPVSSTPTPSPHGEFPPVSSHQTALHEEPIFSFPAGVQSTPEEEEQSHMTEAVDEESRAADSSLSCPSGSSFRLHTSGQTSCISHEDEEASLNVHSEEDDHEDFLAQLTEQVSSDHQRTSDRPKDLGSRDSPEQQIDKTQRFVSPETDSGFSTSDQSRPPTGLSYTQCNTDRLSPSEDINSTSSGKEASHSDLHTAVSLTTWAGWQKMGESGPEQISGSVKNMEEKSTTQNALAGWHITGQIPVCGGEGGTLHNAPLQEPDQEEQFQLKQRPTAAETPTREKHSRCSCSNSDAISALQNEVSRLKRVLEESLGHLPHLCMRMDHLSNMYIQEKRPRSRPRPRHHHRPTSKETDSGQYDHSEMPVSFSPTSIYTHSRTPSITRVHHLKYSSTAASLESLSQSRPRNRHQRASVGPASPDGSVSAGQSCHSSDDSIGPFSDHRKASYGLTRHSSSISIGSDSRGSGTIAGLDSDETDASFRFKSKRSQFNTTYRPPGEKLSLMDRQSPLPAHPLHKTLLQTNYGSCNSLPPGFKVQDQQSDSEVSSKRRTTQSDSAILPSNVYFQQTSPLPTSPCRSRGRPRREKASKEEAINRTLDKALEAALLMKQTTDRMAKTLSTDLAKARTYRKLHGLHPEPPGMDHSSYHTLH